MFSVTPFLEVSQAVAAMGGDSIYQCMQCGLCSALCPWSVVDGLFYTRKLMRMGQIGVEGFESDDILYACTTCKLCVDNCPRGLKIIDIIRAMRAMIAETGAAPPVLRTVMGSIHSRGNPWSGDRSERNKLMIDLNIPTFRASTTEYFLSVCCTSVYDPRSQNVTRVLNKVLKAAQVSFGVIGNNESCCGESLRKIGGEEEFANLVSKNIELFYSNGVKNIVVTSPHCLMTYSQEYPNLGGDFKVIHYVQLLAQLIFDGKIRLSNKGLKAKVIYHDPCYLGRHSEIFEAPRAILKAINNIDLVEFDRNRKMALCCGGGGGRLWMETKPEQRFSTYKIREANTKGAAIIATVCPYCINMFADSIKSENLDGEIVVKDIVEIVSEVL